MNQQSVSKPIKVYVQVTADFTAEGMIIPKVIVWEDGVQYAIDRITDIRQAAAKRAGGQGDRYTIMVNGRHSYLFCDRSTHLAGNNVGRGVVERGA